MTQQVDHEGFYRYVMNLKANAPTQGFVTRALLDTQLFVVVGPKHNPPHYQMARHGFHHPVIKDLARPSMLVFTDEAKAKEYTDQSPAIDFSPITIEDLFRMTAHTSQNTCGVMFRLDEGDIYASPADVDDLNHYARYIDMTLLVNANEMNILRDGELVLTLDQLQELDDVLHDSPIVESYSLWAGEIEGVETTVVDIVVPKKLKPEDVVSEHQRLTERCAEIVPNATVIAKPNNRTFNPPVVDR